MQCNPREFVRNHIVVSQSRSRQNWLALFVIGATVPYCVSAQSPARSMHPPQGSVTSQPPAEQGELGSRIAAASAARTGGDPVSIARANLLVIATALRELATLRSIQSAYAEAIGLYQDSLKFEDNPTTRLGLAAAEARTGKYEDAIKIAESVHRSIPTDLNADRMLSSFLMEKGDYSRAIEPFTRLVDAEPSTENLYALGNCLLQTRRPEDRVHAIGVFEQMKKSAGESGSLHVLFGRAFRDAGDLPAAVREFQAAIAQDPHTPHAHYFLGLAKLALNEWKPTPEAEVETKQEAAYYPHDYLANYMTGFLASGDRRYDEAHAYLTAAAAIDPTAPEPVLYMGLDAYAQGDMKQAEVSLRKAVELTGNSEERSNYQIRRAYVDLGRILTSSGRKDEAEVFFAKARELQNKTMEQSQQSIATMASTGGTGSAAAVMPLIGQQENPSLQGSADSTHGAVSATTMAKLTAEERTQAEEQERILRAALGLSYNDLATSEAIRKQYLEAMNHYQEAMRWDDSLAGLQKNLGLCAFRAGDYAQAAQALSHAISEQPENAALQGMLGLSWFNMEQYAKAAKAFGPLGDKGMHDAEIGYSWAASLARIGDMKAATQVLTAFSSEPRNPDVTLLVGQLWTSIGDYTKAIAAFQQARQLDSSLRRVHLYSGLAYIHWQHWPEAEKEFRAELDLAPDDPDALYHLGFVYLQQTRIDDAIVLFQRVVASHPEYSNAQYQIGKIRLDRGHVADAILYLESAARLSPQTDYIHYQLQSAYRKDNRIEDADRELETYKQLKAKSRERAAEGSTIH